MQHTPSPRDVNKPSQTPRRSDRDSVVSKIGNQSRDGSPGGAPGRQHEKPRREEKQRRPEFDQEYDGKTVRLTLFNGTAVIGKAETSKYWLKIKTPGDKVIYVNKAFIVMIEPAEQP